MSGCPEESPEGIDPGVTQTDGNIEGTTPYPGESGDEGAGSYQGCLRFPADSEWAFQHQCGGQANIEVNLNAVGVLVGDFAGAHTIPLTIFFGGADESDSYEKPKVMACCSPLDEEDYWTTAHYPACYHDLIENGCRSLVSRIYALKDQPGVPLAANAQVNQLAEWIASHQQECYEEFWIASEAADWEPVSQFDDFPTHTWVLPSGAWTSNIEDIEIVLDFASVTGIHLPSDPNDWIECESQKDNNDVSFGIDRPEPRAHLRADRRNHRPGRGARKRVGRCERRACVGCHLMRGVLVHLP